MSAKRPHQMRVPGVCLCGGNVWRAVLMPNGERRDVCIVCGNEPMSIEHDAETKKPCPLCRTGLVSAAIFTRARKLLASIGLVSSDDTHDEPTVTPAAHEPVCVACVRAESGHCAKHCAFCAVDPLRCMDHA